MADRFNIYEFSGLRFSPFDSVLENTANGKKIKLTQTQCHFLLAVVIKSPEIIDYDELRQKVWVQYAEMSESLKHLIHETKRGLVKTLKTEYFPADFIKVKPGKGYQIIAPIRTVSENTTKDADLENEFSPFTFSKVAAANLQVADKVNSYTFFKVVSAFFYGMLFALVLLLEIAYQFDRYGKTAIWLSLPLTIWNGGIMFVALSSIQFFFLKNGRTGFGFGVFLLIIGAVFSCLAMSLFLPFEAITFARFQTQPAFAAFLKNVLIYLLPLGVFCLFTPFYLISRKLRQTLQNILPNLFGILFLALVYSLFSTFYLLDNLLPSAFHGLFVTLIFLRFIIYFGLGAACLLWAKTEFEDDWVEVFSFRRQWQKAAIFSLFGVGLYLVMTANRNFKSPRLETVELRTLPNRERQFFVDMNGAYFESETICIRVVGADCSKNAPCLIPNGALKKHSVIKENRLENIPLTLPPGEFQIFAQNGDSPVSNPIVLTVP